MCVLGVHSIKTLDGNKYGRKAFGFIILCCAMYCVCVLLSFHPQQGSKDSVNIKIAMYNCILGSDNTRDVTHYYLPSAVSEAGLYIMITIVYAVVDLGGAPPFHLAGSLH